ncbi:hypothetical protein CCP3SC1AL1_1660001 [Gammaproteobacteria bacterium]
MIKDINVLTNAYSPNGVLGKLEVEAKTEEERQKTWKEKMKNFGTNPWLYKSFLETGNKYLSGENELGIMDITDPTDRTKLVIEVASKIPDTQYILNPGYIDQLGYMVRTSSKGVGQNYYINSKGERVTGDPRLQNAVGLALSNHPDIMRDINMEVDYLGYIQGWSEETKQQEAGKRVQNLFTLGEQFAHTLSTGSKTFDQGYKWKKEQETYSLPLTIHQNFIDGKIEDVKTKFNDLKTVTGNIYGYDESNMAVSGSASKEQQEEITKLRTKYAVLDQQIRLQADNAIGMPQGLTVKEQTKWRQNAKTKNGMTWDQAQTHMFLNTVELIETNDAKNLYTVYSPSTKDWNIGFLNGIISMTGFEPGKFKLDKIDETGNIINKEDKTYSTLFASDGTIDKNTSAQILTNPSTNKFEVWIYDNAGERYKLNENTLPVHIREFSDYTTKVTNAYINRYSKHLSDPIIDNKLSKTPNGNVGYKVTMVNANGMVYEYYIKNPKENVKSTNNIINEGFSVPYDQYILNKATEYEYLFNPEAKGNKVYSYKSTLQQDNSFENYNSEEEF